MSVDFGPLQSACRDTFGSTVTYTPASSGTPETIAGVFNAKTLVVEDGLAVLVDQPTLGVKLADFSDEPRVGDTCVVNAVSYKVGHVDKDGEGMATLNLQRTS